MRNKYKRLFFQPESQGPGAQDRGGHTRLALMQGSWRLAGGPGAALEPGGGSAPPHTHTLRAGSMLWWGDIPRQDLCYCGRGYFRMGSMLPCEGCTSRQDLCYCGRLFQGRMCVTVRGCFRTGSMLLGKVGVSRAGSVLLWGIFQSGIYATV